MPHIEISCYPGKTEDQKRELTERFVNDMEDIFGNNPDATFI